VIVGGGFGGLAAARSLGGEDVDVVLVDRRNHHLFQPLLYQVATAGLSPSNIAQPIRSILKRKRNVTTLMGEVVGVDRDTRTVKLADGSLPYDYLVLACGVRSHYFGRDEWAQHAPGLKTITDALELRTRTLMAFEAAERCSDELERRRLLTFVVVGAGPTGVEMAGAIADIARSVLHQDYRAIDSAQAKVLLIEGGPRVLPSYDEGLSASAKSQLEKIGVEVRLDTRVEQIDARGVVAGGTRIDAAVVVWAAGLRAEDVYGALGVERDRMGRVCVEPTLLVRGCEREFAIGDGAALEEGGRVLPGVAPVATQQGVHVGRNIVRARRGEALVSFRYRDKGQMATIGRARAVAAAGKFQMTGFVAWLAWLFIHLLFLVGLQNRLLVFSQWVYAYLASKRSARLIVEPIRADTRPEPTG
jgi:NADH dehydrogenase